MAASNLDERLEMDLPSVKVVVDDAAGFSTNLVSRSRGDSTNVDMQEAYGSGRLRKGETIQTWLIQT